MTSPVPLYCSHSYRPADRELNIHFWKLLHAAGFTVTVDPKSTVLSTTSLELMMARSAGFVAVVTHRPEVPVYECSPFAVHEYGLAFQARKPRLVLRDKNVSPLYFDIGDTIDIEFDRDALHRSNDSLAAALQRFHAMASAQSGLRYRRGRVGVALPHGERREAVERVVRTTGDRPVDLWEISEDPFSLAINAERCDYVVVDLDEPAAVHVADFLQGNATPLLKIAQRGDVPLRLLGTAPLREAAAASELIMYWDDPQTFESKLLQEVARARTGRREFASLEAGQSYFRSLGRTALPVFVSNAGSSSDLARALTDAMSLENIPFFHYQFSNSIGIGRKWADELTELVEASKVFVMLVDKGYWQSEWCRMEYEAATRLAELDRTVVVPFLLGDDTGPVLPRQGKDLRGTPPGEQVRIIVDELDKLFVAAETAPANVVAESGAMVAGTVLVDIAIVTILEEEYEAVLGRLSNVCPVAGTVTTPNNHSWVVGEIYSPVYKASFRVVLTLSSVGTNAALAATMNTIPVFEPQYVLVVGWRAVLAIQDAREKQRGIGFGMIRGISDVPREGGSRPGRTPGQSEQTETRDAMKKRASAAAATCAAELIRHAWPRPPRKQTPQ